MPKLRAICPHCDATFNVKDRSAVGKRVKCPTCSEPFRIKIDEPKDGIDDLFDEDGYDDEYDDYEEDDFGDDEFFEDDRRRPAPSRGAKSTKKKGTKKSKKGKGKKANDKTGSMLVIGVAAVLLVGVLGVGGYLVSRMFGGGGGLDTSYLPPDSELVVQMNVPALLDSELLGPQFDQPGANPFGGGDDGNVRDIRKITIGVSGLANIDPTSFDDNPMAAMQAMQSIDWLMVIQSRKRLIDDSAEHGFAKKNHGGEEYSVVPFFGMSIWQAGSRTVLVGSEKAIKGAIDRGAGSSSLEQYAFVDGSRDIVIASRPSSANLEKLRSQDANAIANMPGVPESVKSAYKNVQEGVVGFAMGMDVDSDVDVVLQFEADGDDRASTLEGDFQKLVELASTTVNEFGGQMPADAAEVARALLEDVSIAREGKTISVSMHFPGDLQHRLQNIDPAEIGGLFAGMGGGDAGHDHGMAHEEIGGGGFDPGPQPVPGGGNDGPRVGEAAGATVAGPKVVFDVEGFEGNGPPAREARRIISRSARTWADSLRFAYDGDAGEIHVGVKPGARTETASVKAALEASGFQIGDITEPAGEGNVAGGPGPRPMPVQPAPGGGFAADPLTPAAAAIRKADANNLKQIGIAIHNYHDTYGELPTDVFAADGRTRLLSWRVRLLPFLEQQALYDQFNLEESWDGPTNGPLAAKMPAVFRSPARPELTKPANLVKTSYIVFTNGTMMGDKGPLRFRDVTDGTSNTIAVIEGGGAGHFPEWTKPHGTHSVHSLHLAARIDWNKEYPGFNALFGDGRVRFYTKGLSGGDLGKMLSRAGGEIVSVENGSVEVPEK